MAYQALYRKWRPTTFEQVVGQTATVKTLRNQIESGRIAHAYLFCGCRGTGKTSMAKLMSRAINCLQPNHGDPCGECEVCRAIQSESTMDVLELDAASNNSVENIRELLEQVRYPAQMGKYKVYIIDEVHMLSTAAFNALLKTLEEPPAHVVFILATTEPQKLPATILSRVQRYDFGRIPAALMVERMKEALADMGISAEEEALSMIARAAEGALRDAFSILDMCVAGTENGCITAAQVREALGASDREFLFAFMEAVAQRDMSGVLHKVDELMRSGREPQVFLKELSGHCRALLMVKAVEGDAASLLEITTEDEQRYREQGAQFSKQRLLRILDLFLQGEGELRFASAPRIALESAALHACEEQAGEDTVALLERIAELETSLKAMKQAISNGSVVSGEAIDRAREAKSPQEEGERKGKMAGSKERSQQSEHKAAAPSRDAKEVWAAALAKLAKNEPPLFGLVRNERFLGAEGNVYRLSIPYAKKDFSYLKLSQPARKEILSRLLTEVGGMPAVFEAVLEQSGSDQQIKNVQESAQQSLIEAFGRELVQIDEDEPK